MSRLNFFIPLGQSDGCPFGFKRAAGGDLYGAVGSVVSSVLSGIFSSTQQEDAQDFSSDQASIAYERQRELNEQGYDISKRLMDAQNAYNAPAAAVERYRQAGLNPFLLAHGNNIGSGNSVGSQPSPSGSAPQAQTPHPNPIQVPDLGSLLVQSSAVKNDALKAKAEFIKSMPDLVKSVGSKKAQEIASNIFGNNLDTSFLTRSIEAYVSRQESESNLAKVHSFLVDKYGDKQAQQMYDRGEQEISNLMLEGTEILSRTALNKSNVAKNEAEVREIASKVIRNLAESWKLRKEGDYYVANAATVNQLRQFVVSSARSQANMLSNESFLSGSEPDTPLFDYFHSGHYAKNRVNASENQMSFNASTVCFIIDKIFGDYIKILGSPSAEFTPGPVPVSGFRR